MNVFNVKNLAILYNQWGNKIKIYHLILTPSRSTKSNLLKHMILCIIKVRNIAVHIVSPIVAYFILTNQNQPKYILNKFLDKDYLR